MSDKSDKNDNREAEEALQVEVVEVAVMDILDLVNCAETYGHTNQILMQAFASWLDYSVSDEDIEAYSSQYLTEESRKQGYGEEDYEEAKETLTEWRDRYCVHPDDREAETPETPPTKH